MTGLDGLGDRTQHLVVEYEPDSELCDTGQVALQDVGGTEGFRGRKVLPYAEDAWYLPKSEEIGYEISLT